MSVRKEIAVWVSLLAMMMVPAVVWPQDETGGTTREEPERLTEEDRERASALDWDSSSDVALYLQDITRRSSARYKDTETLVMTIQGQGLDLGYEGFGECAAASCEAYKKEVIEGEDGEEQHVLRPLTTNEIAVMAGLSVGSSGMKLYGITTMMAQVELNRAIEGAVAGGLGGPAFVLLTRELRSDEGQQGSAAFANPMTMFNRGGKFALAAGATVDNAIDSLLRGKAQAQEEEIKRRELMQNAEFGADEDLEGVPTKTVIVSDINQVMESDQGDEFVLNSIFLWANLEHGYIVKYRIEGTAEQGGTDREFFVESTLSDFRTVPGTDLFEPYKTSNCMGGVMTPREQEQLVEAREQLAELDAQLAAMPADQRQMMQNMMGNQLDSLRNMAADGALCNVRQIEAIYVNPDLKALYSAAPMDGVVMPTTAGEESLVQRIQLDLSALGYEPGNITGEITTGTVIAISQYQAEREMEVTGEATQELAEALTAELLQ